MASLLRSRTDHPMTTQAVIGAFVSHVMTTFGHTIGDRMLGTMAAMEGHEGILAMARLYTEGRLMIKAQLWARWPGAPVEAMAWVIGMVYGPPGQLVIDAHVFRARAGAAPQWGAGLIAAALKQLTITADKAGAWTMGGTWRGRELRALVTRYKLGFTIGNETYRHTDGRTYTFFFRPPC